MNTGKTIALVVGGVAVVGIGVWALTRKKNGSTTTTTTTTTPGPGTTLQDPSTQTPDTLGGFVGNLLSTLWVNSRNPQTNNAGQVLCGGVAVPANPYASDGFTASNYSSTQIKLMQTYLSSLNSDIATVITETGGVDGVIGNGFREAYNMARKGCFITGVSDLVSKSGA